MGPSWKWLVGVLVLLVGSLLGFGVSNTVGNIHAAAAQAEQASTVNGKQNERIGILESSADIRDDLLGKRLDRLEGKVDELIKAVKR
jgi:hypothetical protein